MSFDFKGPSFKPMIQEAQHMQNNGGGGNLGYFKREQKEEEKKKNESIDVFGEEEKDSFEYHLEEENKSFDLSSIKKWFFNLIKRIKKNSEKHKNPFEQNINP